jgi:glucose/arabinose dehydrogenase
MLLRSNQRWRMKTLSVLPFFSNYSSLRHPAPCGSASRFALRVVAWLLLLVCLSLSVRASTLPGGFTETQLAKGLDPTNLEVAPDGRIFVTEKNGKVHIIKNGALLARPFLSLTVDNFNERGLMSLIFDPDFASNGYVYVYYTVPRTASSAAHNRVSRFTASGDVVVADSERILLELDALQAGNHNGGALLFRDGKLLVATGENARASISQSFNTLLGKILRINPDGSIPADNPFYGSTTGKHQAIWALGLRNPYKLALQPGTGRLFINDVGGSRFEEINEGIPGKNYGWPGIEGFRTTQTPPADYQDPLYAYGRNQGCSITGGTFYNPATVQFPDRYVGKYFFADYCNGYLKVLDPASGTVTETFATGIKRPVDVKVGPDGSLYYLARPGQGGNSVEENTAIRNGEVWRVNYTGSSAPAISSQPTDQTVSLGSSVTFSVDATGVQPLSYQWQRNGIPIAAATAAAYSIATVTAADNGATFRVVVSNATGKATSNAATLTVTNNQLPVPTITAPAGDYRFSGGDVVTFSGNATDPEDGVLPAAAYTWWVDLHHDEHVHPALAPTSGGKGGTFTIPAHNETDDNIWYRLYLRVVDSKGQTKTVYREIAPRKADVTLVTSPAGMQVKLDGQTVATPYTFTGVVGIVRNIEAVTPQTAGGSTYQASTWSDGGAASHDIATPAVNTTYTASFLRKPENPVHTTTGLQYQYYEGTWSNPPDFDSLTPLKTGTTAAFDLSPRNRNQNYGFRYRGYVEIPADGSYSFYTHSAGGSRLYIGNTLVVDNEESPAGRESSGTIGLQAGKHAIMVTYFVRESDEVLAVSYAGPGTEKGELPGSMLYREPVPAPVSLLLEAEAAVMSGVRASELYPGYTGTGFATYTNANEDYLEWTAPVAEPGSYALTFRYGLGNPINRPLAISVNGSVVQPSLAFPSTGSWDNWQTVTMTARLNAGRNTVRATAIGSSGANIDHLKVTSDTGEPLASSPPPTGSAAAIRLAPVPANDLLVITSQAALQGEVRIIDAKGIAFTPVYQQRAPYRIILNVSGLKPGLYFLTLLTRSGTVTEKVLIFR